MDQISACRKKLVSGLYFMVLYYATLVDALQHLS